MTLKRNRNPSVESRNSFQWRIHLCSALNSRRLSRFLNVACLCFFVTPPQCFHFFSFSQKVNNIFSFSLSASMSPRLNVFTFSVFSVSHKKVTVFSLFLFLLLCHHASVFSVSHKKVTVFSLFHNQATVFSLSCERLTNWTGTSDTSVSTLLIGLVKDNWSVHAK